MTLEIRIICTYLWYMSKHIFSVKYKGVQLASVYFQCYTLLQFQCIRADHKQQTFGKILKPKWKWKPQKAPTSHTGCRGQEGLETSFLLPFSHRLKHFCSPVCPGVRFGHRDYRTTPVWLLKSKCCYTAAALHIWKMQSDLRRARLFHI